jgi:hypothetical protein
MASEGATKLRPVGPIFMFMGFLAVIIGVLEIVSTGRIKEHGTEVMGEVLGHTTMYALPGVKSYKLIVKYQPGEGQPVYRKDFLVPQETYEATTDGGPVPIQYLTSDPTVAQIASGLDQASEHITLGIVLGLVGLALFVSPVRAPAPVPPEAPATPEPKPTTA